MQLWRYKTDDAPARPGPAVTWRHAMDRLCLPTETLSPRRAIRGEIVSVRSPLGVEFARVRAQAHEISGAFPAQEPAVWLTVLLAGAGEVEQASGERVALSPGAVVYGATGTPAAMRFSTPFDQLFVKAPRAVLDRRSVRLGVAGLRLMPTGLGAPAVFRSLLTATAEGLEHLGADQLRAVDLAVVEFLSVCLHRDAAPPQAETATVGGPLRPVLDRLDLAIDDPDLTLVAFSRSLKLSPRSVQKLFASEGDTFSDYVRRRRLELCRRDLGDAAMRHESISSICFRHGFNASAHFSHAFRDAYGASPREHRRSVVSGSAAS